MYRLGLNIFSPFDRCIENETNSYFNYVYDVGRDRNARGKEREKKPCHCDKE
jgi:hypothetical protein